MSKPAVTDHPIHEILAARWSPRAFTDTPVSDEDLRSLLEAARWAASSFNEQPWRYIIAKRDQPEEFARLLECLTPANQTWAREAPVLMLGIARTAFTQNNAPNRVAFHDLGAASAGLTFEASARGLVVHQMAGILPDKVRETYAIPTGYEPLTALAIGYEGSPDTLPENLQGPEKASRSRKPLSEFVFGGAWEQAAELARPRHEPKV